MYTYLIFFHSIFRWLVLFSLLYALYRAYSGYTGKRAFGKADNSIRHWTATISHIQLMMGMTLYFISPVTAYFFANTREAITLGEPRFFGIIHIFCMTVAVVVITIGSALAKRRETDAEKFKTMLVWFGVALIIIFLAIPWPFSPLAHRPYLPKL